MMRPSRHADQCDGEPLTLLPRFLLHNNALHAPTEPRELYGPVPASSSQLQPPAPTTCTWCPGSPLAWRLATTVWYILAGTGTVTSSWPDTCTGYAENIKCLYVYILNFSSCELTLAVLSRNDNVSVFRVNFHSSRDLRQVLRGGHLHQGVNTCLVVHLSHPLHLKT